MITDACYPNPEGVRTCRVRFARRGFVALAVVLAALTVVMARAGADTRSVARTLDGLPGHATVPSAIKDRDRALTLSTLAPGADPMVGIAASPAPGVDIAILSRPEADALSRTGGSPFAPPPGSMTARFALADQTRNSPALAVGVGGLGANGDRRTAFVVVSRSAYRFDVSGGFVWRENDQPATLQPTPTPLSPPAPGIDRGRIQPFAGLTWHSPDNRWSLDLAYHGDRPVTPDFGPPPPDTDRFSPVAASVTYRLGERLRLGLAHDGRETMATVTFDLARSSPHDSHPPPTAAPPGVSATSRAAIRGNPEGDAAMTEFRTDARGLAGPRMIVPRALIDDFKRGGLTAAELWRGAELLDPPATVGLPHHPRDWRLHWAVQARAGIDPAPVPGLTAARATLDADVELALGGGLVLGLGHRLFAETRARFPGLPPFLPPGRDTALAFQTPARAFAGYRVSLGGGWYGALHAGLLSPEHKGVHAELVTAPVNARVRAGLDFSHAHSRHHARPLADALFVPVEQARSRTKAGVTLALDWPRSNVRSRFRFGGFADGDHGVRLDVTRAIEGPLTLHSHLALTDGDSPGDTRGPPALAFGVGLSIPLAGLAGGTHEARARMNTLSTAETTGRRLDQPFSIMDALDRMDQGRWLESWPGPAMDE